MKTLPWTFLFILTQCPPPTSEPLTLESPKPTKTVTLVVLSMSILFIRYFVKNKNYLV